MNSNQTSPDILPSQEVISSHGKGATEAIASL